MNQIVFVFLELNEERSNHSILGFLFFFFGFGALD
jgi:hypothetical protein